MEKKGTKRKSRYEVTHNVTREVKEVVATSEEEACNKLGWEVELCYVKELSPSMRNRLDIYKNVIYNNTAEKGAFDCALTFITKRDTFKGDEDDLRDLFVLTRVFYNWVNSKELDIQKGIDMYKKEKKRAVKKQIAILCRELKINKEKFNFLCSELFISIDEDKRLEKLSTLEKLLQALRKLESEEISIYRDSKGKLQLLL